MRLLMISEQNAPNVTVYPDTNEAGIYDMARPDERRLGALFNLSDAVSRNAGGQPNSELPETEGPALAASPRRPARAASSPSSSSAPSR